MVFDRHGPLAARIPEYRERSQQVEMANRVAGAIRDNAVLVCEAGTGTGKTFAYLVPALLSAGKVILSTGTKTLQDQLYHRDLPTVRAALNVPVTTALLKGRANYVCHYHLERNLAEAGTSSREFASDLQRIVSFARVTRSGDKSELADVPEEAAAWNLATSTPRATFTRKRSPVRRTCPIPCGSALRWTRRRGICASAFPAKTRASPQRRSGESARSRMRSRRSIPRYARYARRSTRSPNAAKVLRAAPSARGPRRRCSNAGATTAAPIWSAGSRYSAIRSG